MSAAGWLLVVAADRARALAWTDALGGVGAVRSAADAAEALAQIRRERPRVTVLAADLDVGALIDVVNAVADPLSVVALVRPEATETAVRLAEAGVALQLPDSIPGPALRRVVERLRERASSDDAERLRRVLAAVSHARHEVNNPLTSILAEAQLLLMDAATLPPDAQKSVQTIQEMANRIRDVVRSLQGFQEGS